MRFDKKVFGKRVAELRKTSGLTQEKMSEMLHISIDQIRKVEQAKVNCSIELLLQLTEIFNVSTDYLLKGKNYDSGNSREQLRTIANTLLQIANDF